MIAPFSTFQLETEVGPMPARVYGQAAAKAGAPLVLHLHGGAFTSGTVDCGAIAAALMAEAGAVVLSADYPLAVGHPFPFPLTAAFAALVAVYRNRAAIASRTARLFVAGEEAGGNLAAGIAMMARDQKAPPLAGQILISPMLDPSLATASVRAAEAGACGCPWADGWKRYLGSADKAAHPYAAPLASQRLAGLAPALLVSTADHPMRDESVRYAAALGAAGVPTTLEILPGPEQPVASRIRAPGTPLKTPQDCMSSLRAIVAAFFASARPRRRAAAGATSTSAERNGPS